MQDFPELTLGAALREQAAKRGGSEFIVFPNRGARFTFDDVDKRADAIARGLLAAGLKKGDHIGIWAYNVPDWAPVFYAAARVGIVTVPINVNCKHKELGFVLDQADIKGLFILDGFKDTNFPDILYDLIPELKNSEKGRLESGRFSCLKLLVNIDKTSHQGICTLEELIQGGGRIDDALLRKAELDVDKQDIACIIYTSGTTGIPKGAMLTHSNLLNNGKCANRLGVMDDTAVILNPLPFFYITSLMGGLVESLVWAYKLVVLEAFDIVRCLEVIQSEACSWIFGVPTMYIAMLSHPRFSDFNMASVEYACIGGAMCPPDLLETIIAKFQLKGLYLAYGLTESSPFITDVVIQNPSDPRIATVGDPIPGIEVNIRHIDTNEICPAGGQGEVCARGHNIMKGYYKMEEATRAVIDQDGWLHTGDLGHLLSNGCLVIDGRIKDVIIRGGEKIYPKEVENLLIAMPGIQNVQVAGISSRKYGEEVGAFVIPQPGASITENEIIDFCKEKISHYKVPKYVFFMDSFPLSANGKVQKFKLNEIGLQEVRAKGTAT